MVPAFQLTRAAVDPNTMLTNAGDTCTAPCVSGAAGTAIRVIRTPDDLDALEPAWDALAARSGKPMQDFDWIRACAATFAPNGQLHVVAVGDPPRLTAVAPLVRRRKGSDRLELLGVEELYEPTDVLSADPAALTLLARDLVRSGAPICLKRMSVDSPLVPALKQSFRWRGMVFSRLVPGAPWIPLDAGWKQPEHLLSARRRADLRRAQRIAERIGPVTYEVLAPAPNELHSLLEEAFQVEAASWKGRSGSALAHDALKGAFYRRYAAAASRKGVLRLCFLRIGGRAAAMQLAIECGNRFWLLKIGYDEAFARCSPGSLLLLETVRYAARRGLHSYEFLGTAESWTHMWTTCMRPCVSLLAYPANRRGLAAFAADVLTSVRKRFR